MIMVIDRFEQLRVYQQAFEKSMQVFELSKTWPKEERYALTDQIRRSSRSVCANIAEAWCKRQFERHFSSKLSDAHAEASETRVWLRFAYRCGYLPETQFKELDEAYDVLIGGLVRMLTAPEKWCGPANLIREDDSDYVTSPTPPIYNSD